MANVKFSRKEFEKSIKLTKEIEEKISMFGTPFESANNEEIEIEIFPNRPDLLSLQGYIRAFLSFIGKSKIKEYKAKKSGFKLLVDKSLPKQWPYAFACIVKNLKFNDERIKEVIQIQEKLGATLLRNRKKGGIGLYPLEKLTFPIKFVGMKPEDIKFRPLEFPRIITGRQILSQHPTGREYAHLCQDWDKFPVFIDSKGIIMSMPPIINSHDVGKIDETTKEVFIEATGTDPISLQKALTIIVTALADMGGEIYSIECQQQDSKKIDIPNLSTQKLKLDLDNVNKMLGLNLSQVEIKKLLEKMNIRYSSGVAEVPAYRVDVMHEVDLIEDIAIAYGYENFKPAIPDIATIGQENPRNSLRRKIAEVLIGLEYLENSSHHLTSKDDEEKALTNSSIEVINSKTDFCLLRDNLFSSSLKILGENTDKEYPQKIFEINRVFNKDSSQETSIKESEHLVLASIPSNFTSLKQELEYLFKMLGKEIKFQETEDPRFISGRTAQVLINNKTLGIIGEVHPQILKNFHLKMPLVLCEIDLESLF